MHIEGLHHIQLAMPAGQEDVARRFYTGLLGIPEVPKPPELAKRGGVWFERENLKIHLGVDPDFRPARKAHPGLLVDELPRVIEKLRAEGIEIAQAEPLPDFDHIYVSDPFGNRLELMEQIKRGSGTAFGGVTPILPVRDLKASIDFYVKVLGFEVKFVGPGSFASVSRGRCGLFLSEGDQGNPGAWVWIGVEDVEAVLAELKSKGCDARHPPTNYSWAYEMQIEDLDGNVLRMGSEPRSDLPPAASWRDMRGQLWKKSESGEWFADDEIAWTFQHSVECAVPSRSAWGYWSNVTNWNDPPATFHLDGPFQVGSRLITKLPDQTFHSTITAVGPGHEAVIEMKLSRAILAFHWQFEEVSPNRTRITQRLTLKGPNALQFVEQARVLEQTVPAGMNKLAKTILDQ